MSSNYTMAFDFLWKDNPSFILLTANCLVTEESGDYWQVAAQAIIAMGAE